MGNSTFKLYLIGGIVAAVVILIISLLASSLKKLNSYEVGLQYDTIWKQLSESSKGEGLHSGPPGFEFIKFPSVFKSLSFDDLTCLNKDGVKIILDVSYQYQARANNLHSIVMWFKDHEHYKDVLRTAGESALHEACSAYNTSQFQAERGAFQESVRLKLVSRYSELHCDVTDLQVNNIARPGEYERAIKDKEAARENIKVAENERPRKITQAETARREAETQAEITVAKAMSQARIIENKARADAEAIISKYEQEATAYQTIMSRNRGLHLNAEGFLSYMGVRAIASAKNPVYVGLKTPAKTSYVQP